MAVFQAPFQMLNAQLVLTLIRTEEGQTVGNESYVVLSPIMTKIGGPKKAEKRLQNFSSFIPSCCGSFSGAISNSRLVV